MFDYLQQFRLLDRTGQFTHVSPDPSARYNIQPDDHDEFMDKYCEWVSNDGAICLQESPDNVGPWLIDIDMRLSKLERVYTKKHTKVLMRIALDLVRKHIKKHNHVVAVLLEKSAPRQESDSKGTPIIKDGLHEHITCILDRRSRAWLTSQFIRKANKHEDLQSLWSSLGVDATVAVDAHMECKAWHMYGSAKKLGAEPYLATMFMDYNGYITSCEKAFGDPANLPRYLSIRGHEAVRMKPSSIQSMDVAMPERRKTTRHITKDESEIQAEIKFIKEAGFMEMLCEERADDRLKWMEIGWALYNVSQGSEEGLEMWIEFSKRSNKFVEGECEYEWDRMMKRNMTMGTIMYYAKLDSPEKYEQWKNLSIEGSIQDCLRTPKPDSYYIACIIQKLFKNKFVCAHPKKDIWYSFHHERWHIMPANIDLRTAMNITIYDKIRQQQLKFNKMLFEEEDEEPAKGFNPKVMRKRCEELLAFLHNPRHQDAIKRQAETLLYEPKFILNLDMNTKVFAVLNGVLDLELLTFRPGIPEDYCGLVAGCAYDPTLTWDSPGVIDVMEFFKKVHVDSDLREFYFQSIACCLEGGNINKVAVMHTGDDGSNSKTTSMNFAGRTFGDYAKTVNAEVLCAKRGMNSSGPKPELLRLRGARLAMSPEMGKDEPINLGAFKVLTSIDPQFLRGLYDGEGEDMKPTHTLHVQLNELPPVTKSDQPFWDRMMVLVYESQFIQKKVLDKYPVPKSEAEQFKQKRFHADETLNQKINDWLSPFLWILFEKYKQYKRDGFVVPEKVRHASNKYRAENDMYQQFMDDRVKKGADTDFLPCSELLKEFRVWKIENCPGLRETVNSLVFVKEMSKRKMLGGTSKKKTTLGWYGYALQSNEDEEEECE